MTELKLLTSTLDKETLRTVFDHPEAVRHHIENLLLRLQEEKNSLNRARIHAEIGNYKRGLGELVSAEEHLLAAIAIVEHRAEGRRQAVVYGIRLAHVYHWQAKWSVALEMFNRLLEKTNLSEFHSLKDFVLQHRGKMYFDQGRMQDALDDFESALALRLVKSDQELVDSTQHALTAVRRKLAKTPL